MEFEKQYLTFKEYQELEGKLKKTPFNLLEFRARKLVDEYTFGRLIELDEQIQEVKLCIYSLINEINVYNSIGNKSSESVGSYSVSFGKPITKEQIKVYSTIIQDYLGNCILEDRTPYLYMGVDYYDN